MKEFLKFLLNIIIFFVSIMLMVFFLLPVIIDDRLWWVSLIIAILTPIGMVYYSDKLGIL